jgi:hypothetical protein
MRRGRGMRRRGAITWNRRINSGRIRLRGWLSGLAGKERITHRMEIKNVSEIDDEVGKWLKIAYELDE